MRNSHARRNRLLLALFFGVLSVMFGTTSAQAADAVGQVCPDNGGLFARTLASDGGTFTGILPPPGTRSLYGTTYDLFYVAYPAGTSLADACSLTGYIDASQGNTAGNGQVINAEVWGFDTNNQSPVPAVPGGSIATAPSGGTGGSTGGGGTVTPPTSPADPLDGKGMKLVDDSVSIFTAYVIPAVILILLVVYAWRMSVKLGTRFLNRA